MWAVDWAPTLCIDEPPNLYFYFWQYYDWPAAQEENRRKTNEALQATGELLAKYGVD
jgi:hypothetical protein